MTFKFKDDNPDIYKRLIENIKIRERYPDRIPIICEKHPNSLLPNIGKNKFLVPSDTSFSQFSLLMKKKLSLDGQSSLYLLVSGKHSILGKFELNDIYTKYKDKEDGFLYIYYTNAIIV